MRVLLQTPGHDERLLIVRSRAAAGAVGTVTGLFFVFTQDFGHGESHDDHHDSDSHDKADAEEADSESKDESQGDEEGAKADKKDKKKDDGNKEDKDKSKSVSPDKSDKVCLDKRVYEASVVLTCLGRSPQRGQECQRNIWQAGRPIQY